MLVLNTNSWDWWFNQIPEKLTPDFLDLISGTENVSVSAIYCFEVAWFIKYARIEMNMSFDDWLSEIEKNSGIVILT
jgi:PIN domain nuclease of toxin-antitoxin system